MFHGRHSAAEEMVRELDEVDVSVGSCTVGDPQGLAVYWLTLVGGLHFFLLEGSYFIFFFFFLTRFVLLIFFVLLEEG